MAKQSLLLSQIVVFACACLMFGCKSNAAPAKKDKKLYQIKTDALTVAKGKKANAAFHIVLNKGAKVHPKAPFKCSVTSTKGLKVAKGTLRHPDTKTSKDKRDVKVPVGVTAVGGGQQTVNMACSFFICTAKICARTEEKVKIAAKVK
ncbi:MAG: hypothetical protein CL920_02515 [Deltaproteobacteria bacterium]|nr:hypothetical protein [Deltaproteobacteria bacterium]